MAEVEIEFRADTANATSAVRRIAETTQRIQGAARRAQRGFVGISDRAGEGRRAVQRLRQSFEDVRSAAEQIWTADLASKFTGFFTSAVKGAMGFQEALTQIGKVGGASVEQMEALADPFQRIDPSTLAPNELNMAKVKSKIAEINQRSSFTKHQIAGIMEEVAKLGVRSPKELGKFVDLMEEAGTAFDIDASKVTNQMGKLGNIFGIINAEAGTVDIKRLRAFGNSLNNVADNMASVTEKEILDFAERSGGVGKIAGINETQITAIGGAFKSMGVETERASTAFKNFILAGMGAATNRDRQFFEQISKKMGVTADQAEKVGDKAGRAFKALGIDVKEFQGLMQEGKGAEALVQFLEAAKKKSEETGKSIKELGAFGAISNILGKGEADIFATAFQNVDKFKRALGLAEEGAEGLGNTLAATFGLRGTTAEAAVDALGSELKNIKGALGSTLLPTVKSAAQGLNDLLDPVRKFLSNNQALVASIIKGTAAFIGANGAVLGFHVGVTAVATAVKVLAGAWGRAIIGAIRFGSALNKIAQARLAANFSSLAEQIPVVGGRLSQLTGKLSALNQAPARRSTYRRIGSSITSGLSSIPPAAASARKGLGSFASSLRKTRKLTDVTTGAAKNLKATLLGVGSAAGSLVSGGGDLIGDLGAEAITGRRNREVESGSYRRLRDQMGRTSQASRRMSRTVRGSFTRATASTRSFFSALRGGSTTSAGDLRRLRGEVHQTSTSLQRQSASADLAGSNLSVVGAEAGIAAAEAGLLGKKVREGAQDFARWAPAIGGAIASIAGLVGAVKLLQKHLGNMEKERENLEEIGNRKATQGLANDVGKLASRMRESGKALPEEKFKSHVKFLEKMQKKYGGLEGHIESFKNLQKEMKATGAGTLQGPEADLGKSKKQLQLLAEARKQQQKAAPENPFDFSMKDIPSIEEMARGYMGFVNEIKSTYSNLGVIIRQPFRNFGNWVFKQFQRAKIAWLNFRNAMQGTSLFAQFSKSLANFGSNIKQAFNLDLSTAGKAVVRTLATGIKGTFSAVVSAIKSVVQKIRDFLPGSNAKRGPLSDLTSAGRGLINAFLQGIKGAIPNLIGVLENLGSKIKELLNIDKSGINSGLESIAGQTTTGLSEGERIKAKQRASQVSSPHVQKATAEKDRGGGFSLVPSVSMPSIPMPSLPQMPQLRMPSVNWSAFRQSLLVAKQFWQSQISSFGQGLSKVGIQIANGLARIGNQVRVGVQVGLIQPFRLAGQRAGQAIRQIALIVQRVGIQISNTFRRVGQTALTTLRTAFSRISTVISTSMQQAKMAVIRSINGIIGAIKGVAGKALAAGRSIGSNLAQGITSSLGQVRSAAANLASKARSFLPGSNAEEGPLSDLLSTGPALAESFAKGIKPSSRLHHQLNAIAGQAREALNIEPSAPGDRGLNSLVQRFGVIQQPETQTQQPQQPDIPNFLGNFFQKFIANQQPETQTQQPQQPQLPSTAQNQVLSFRVLQRPQTLVENPATPSLGNIPDLSQAFRVLQKPNEIVTEQPNLPSISRNLGTFSQRFGINRQGEETTGEGETPRGLQTRPAFPTGQQQNITQQQNQNRNTVRSQPTVTINLTVNATDNDDLITKIRESASDLADTLVEELGRREELSFGGGLPD